MQTCDVMTKTLINCSPETSVAKAAKLMRNHNTGDVLVTDEGKLVGILTDRDITIRVTAKSLDPDQVLVRDAMSTRVRTGEPNWNLDKIAKEMGKHQIRRLPIAENRVPIGIVSLSDIALHNSHKSHVTKSLKEISESRGTHRLHSMERGLLRVTLGLGLVLGAVVGLNLFKSGGNLWEQFQGSQLCDKLLDVVQTGRAKMSKALNSI
ncbi:MAG: CBS domain-containing protein [Chloroflexi bacterium]|nr:CBS domain-containing protein [Chloroflexota bacterium]